MKTNFKLKFLRRLKGNPKDVCSTVQIRSSLVVTIEAINSTEAVELARQQLGITWLFVDFVTT